MPKSTFRQIDKIVMKEVIFARLHNVVVATIPRLAYLNWLVLN